MKILFIIPYPLGEVPSQRFRFEQYFASLKGHGIHYEVKPFFRSEEWLAFKKSGSKLTKLLILIRALMHRFAHVVYAKNFDCVFVHREATPIGPPWAEWIIARVFRTKMIYDFDDAIWTTDQESESDLERFLRYRSKVRLICSWSYRVSCGNSYLAAYASRYNSRVTINPTTIDTETWHNPDLHTKKSSTQLTIGWTGSRSTTKYVQNLLPVFEELKKRIGDIRFLIIADCPPDFGRHLIEFKEWTVKREIQDLMEIDIGVMPLPDDEWTRGKCGFKLLQYMALGIPAVASPVGVNAELIDGSNGYLASNGKQWIQALEQLITDSNLRKDLGQRGRQTVREHYSVDSNLDNFLALFC